MEGFDKVSRKDLSAIKKELLLKQKAICPICKKSLIRTPPRDRVVDHDHKTGVIRAVLHRGCNGMEGKVLGSVTRWRGEMRYSEIRKTLLALIDFWDKHQIPQTRYLHPSYKTDSQKRIAALRKRNGRTKVR